MAGFIRPSREPHVRHLGRTGIWQISIPEEGCSSITEQKRAVRLERFENRHGTVWHLQIVDRYDPDVGPLCERFAGTFNIREHTKALVHPDRADE